MARSFDADLMDVQRSVEVPGLDNIAVEVYSYNGKPPRIRVVQKIRSGYAVLLRGMELADTIAIVKVLNSVVNDVKPAVAGRKIKTRKNGRS